MKAPLAALLIAGIFLAGCASAPTSTTTTPPPPPPPEGMAFMSPIDTGAGQGEPGMRLAGNGTIYVHVPGDLVVSTDDGATWTSLAGNINKAGQIFGGDSDLVIGKDGSLYFTDLEELAAISVYRSHDKGATWTENPDASVLPGDDRQWIAAGPDASPAAPAAEAIYLAYNNEAAVTTVSKSIDGGQTWVSIPIAAGTQNNFWSQGNIIVDPKSGEVWVTYDLGNAAKPYGTGTLPYQNAIMVATSTNGGITWTSTQVKLGGPSEDTGQIFPVIAEDGAGNLFVTWSVEASGTDTVYLSASTDHGSTWGTPQKVNQVPHTAVQPWVDATGVGQVAISYYGANETAISGEVTGDWFVYLAESTNALAANVTFGETQVTAEAIHEGGICTFGITCGLPMSGNGSRALLDFFQVRLDDKGSAHIVYADTVHGKSGTGIFYTAQTAGPTLDATVPMAPAA
jgi:hypothetical protein